MHDEEPQFELKRIAKDSVEAAIRKAERYRLLNERRAAESICRDVLEVDPTNRKAIITMILALADLFRDGHASITEARELVSRLDGDYERAYYSGLLCERLAKATFHRNAPGSGTIAYNELREAMEWYEKAESHRPAGNDDPLLRWNTCARLIMQHGELHAPAQDDFQPFLE